MLKVGLVGYGFMGHMHAQCYTATGLAQITAIADPDPEKQKEAKDKLNSATYNSLADLLTNCDVDIIDVCTPTYLHEECVIQAAQAKKHILCEKPFSLSLESCDRMIDAVNKAGVISMVAQVIRFWDEYVTIKEIVDSGKYGKVKWVNAARVSTTPTWSWQQWLLDPKLSGGGILDLHVHDIDFLNYLLGKPTNISANGTIKPNGGIDTAFTNCSGYKNGAISMAHCSLELSDNFPFNMSLTVCLEKASIKFDMSAADSLVVYPMGADSYKPEKPKPDVVSASEGSGNISSLGGYYNEIKYFLDCVSSNKQPTTVTLQDARTAVELCLAATKSVISGAPVQL